MSVHTQGLALTEVRPRDPKPYPLCLDRIRPQNGSVWPPCKVGSIHDPRGAPSRVNISAVARYWLESSMAPTAPHPRCCGRLSWPRVWAGRVERRSRPPLSPSRASYVTAPPPHTPTDRGVSCSLNRRPGTAALRGVNSTSSSMLRSSQLAPSVGGGAGRTAEPPTVVAEPSYLCYDGPVTVPPRGGHTGPTLSGSHARLRAQEGATERAQAHAWHAAGTRASPMGPGEGNGFSSHCCLARRFYRSVAWSGAQIFCRRAPARLRAAA